MKSRRSFEDQSKHARRTSTMPGRSANSEDGTLSGPGTYPNLQLEFRTGSRSTRASKSMHTCTPPSRVRLKPLSATKADLQPVRVSSNPVTPGKVSAEWANWSRVKSCGGATPTSAGDDRLPTPHALGEGHTASRKPRGHRVVDAHGAQTR